MMQDLEQAIGFSKGDVVQMLVETSGQDADDNELTIPVGAVAIIDRIERLPEPQGIALTLVIEGKIVNVSMRAMVYRPRSSSNQSGRTRRKISAPSRSQT